MTPTINDILFYITILFVSNILIISEQTSITIDFENKAGQIEYMNLKTASKNTHLVKSELLKISKATEIDEYFDQLKFTSMKIFKKNKKLNATLSFTFINKKELLEVLYFYPNPNGNIQYRILESEKLLYSNGQNMNEGDIKFVQWAKSQNEIELTLRHKKLAGDEFEQFISLEKYWEL